MFDFACKPAEFYPENYAIHRQSKIEDRELRGLLEKDSDTINVLAQWAVRCKEKLGSIEEKAQCDVFYQFLTFDWSLLSGNVLGSSALEKTTLSQGNVEKFSASVERKGEKRKADKITFPPIGGAVDATPPNKKDRKITDMRLTAEKDKRPRVMPRVTTNKLTHFKTSGKSGKRGHDRGHRHGGGQRY